MLLIAMSSLQLVKQPLQTPAHKFAERVNDLMPRVVHSCARNEADRKLVFTMRYQAYRRQNIVKDISNGMLYDGDYDESPNCYITMTYIDGDFVSTFRLHWAADLSQHLPSHGVFSDLIDPYLRKGYVVLDPTRLAARFEASRKYPELPFVALRPAWLAAAHFEADVVLATVAAEHTAFYKRVFGYEALCAPRDYPRVVFPIVCLALDFPRVRDSVESRYPFFKSTQKEREALFGPSPANVASEPPAFRLSERLL